MKQVARKVRMADIGFLGQRYVIHDRDGKDCLAFDHIIEAAGVKPLKLPARSPNLNSYAERWVRSVKDECLSKPILFGESSLRRALTAYVENFHRRDRGIVFRLFVKSLARGTVVVLGL